MAVSGTYAFSPSIGDIVLNAYGRIGLRRASLLAEHLTDAETESNFLLVEFANRQPNLWTSELQSIPLVQGTATYSLPARTIAILAAYIQTGSNPAIDRIIYPVSTTEYAAFPNKTTQGTPTVFWFNRQITPEVVLWQPPDGSQSYTLYLRCVRQIQDANLPSGETPEIPYRWLDAFTSALAARLALIYKPDLVQMLDAKAERAWQIAAAQDTEDVPLYVTPGLSSYFNQG